MQRCTVGDVVAHVVAAARRPAVRSDRTVVIGIDGRSGTGKTTTAAQVSAELGSAPIVHMDDLYPGWHGLAAAVPRLVQEVLEPLAAGEPAAYRRHDWDRGEYAETIEIPPGPFLVVEGCGSTTGPARELTDVRVWLEAEPGVRRARSLGRDSEMFRPRWQMWRDQEDALFGPDHTADHAHLRLTTG